MSDSFKTILGELGAAFDDRFATLEEAIGKSAGTPAAKPKKRAGKKKKVTEITLDDLRAALMLVIDHKNGGRPACAEILSKFEVKKIAELAETDYEALLEETQKFLDANAETEEPEEDDIPF